MTGRADDAVSIFKAAAGEYDALRRRAVPVFDPFDGHVVRMLTNQPKRILDLGAGTGLLTRMVLEADPEARAVVVDGAAEMLTQAEVALGDRIEAAHVQDLADPLPEGPFDAVVSTFAIHHLDDPGKADLYARIFHVLAPGGPFVNGEQVAGPRPPSTPCTGAGTRRTRAPWAPTTPSGRPRWSACGSTSRRRWSRSSSGSGTPASWTWTVPGAPAASRCSPAAAPEPQTTRRTMTMADIREIRQQGPYHYVFSRYADPIATVEPGETVAIYTEDAFEGRITTEDDLPSKVLGSYLNPQTGPIYVEGAEPGDTLAVKIETIEPTRDWAVSVFVPYFGGLTAPGHPPAARPAARAESGSTSSRTACSRHGERLAFPWRPFMGTIGTAPELEAISALDAARPRRQHGRAATPTPATPSTCRCACPARSSSPATPTPARATASSAASRSRSPPARCSPST